MTGHIEISTIFTFYFFLLINISFIIISGYIGYRSLWVYVNEPVNREENLYWGTSFIFVALGFVIYAIHDIFRLETISGTAFLIHNSDMIAWTFQGLALLKILKYAEKDENYKQLFMLRNFKLIRVFFLTAFATYILLVPVFSKHIAWYAHVPSLQIIGVEWIDILYESWNVALGLLILLSLYTLYQLKVDALTLADGYFFITASEVMQICHIILSHNKYNNMILWTAEWILALIGIIYLFIGVYRITTTPKSNKKGEK